MNDITLLEDNQRSLG